MDRALLFPALFSPVCKQHIALFRLRCRLLVSDVGIPTAEHAEGRGVLAAGAPGPAPRQSRLFTPQNEQTPSACLFSKEPFVFLCLKVVLLSVLSYRGGLGMCWRRAPEIKH